MSELFAGILRFAKGLAALHPAHLAHMALTLIVLGMLWHSAAETSAARQQMEAVIAANKTLQVLDPRVAILESATRREARRRADFADAIAQGEKSPALAHLLREP